MSPSSFCSLRFAYTVLAFSLLQWPWSLAYGTVFTQGTDLPWNLQAVCCFQGTTSIFSEKREKVEIQEKQGLKPHTPNLLGLNPEACGGLNSSFVRSSLTG